MQNTGEYFPNFTTVKGNTYRERLRGWRDYSWRYVLDKARWVIQLSTRNSKIAEANTLSLYCVAAAETANDKLGNSLGGKCENEIMNHSVQLSTTMPTRRPFGRSRRSERGVVNQETICIISHIDPVCYLPSTELYTSDEIRSQFTRFRKLSNF